MTRGSLWLFYVNAVAGNLKQPVDDWAYYVDASMAKPFGARGGLSGGPAAGLDADAAGSAPRTEP